MFGRVRCSIGIIFITHPRCPTKKNPPTKKTTKATGAIKTSIQGSSLASVTACRAGEYMSGSGCRQCIPGSVSKAGSAECEMCQMGTFANAATNTCDKCAPGTASAALRATSCMPCHGGKFSDKEGSVMCSACKEGFTTPRDKMPHTTCAVAPPEADLPTKNANGTYTAPPGTAAPVPEVDDAKFDELFEDIDEKADAVFASPAGGKADGGKGDGKGAERAAKIAALAGEAGASAGSLAAALGDGAESRP